MATPSAPKPVLSSSAALAERAEIERAIDLLFRPGDVVEVRIPKTRAGVVAGYFDGFSAMARAICDSDAKYRAAGVYYVLNSINPALLGRAYNRLKEYALYTTSDSNVLRRRWLPVDLDPVRPAGVSSSDAEHRAAIARARTIADDLETKWLRPIMQRILSRVPCAETRVLEHKSGRRFGARQK